MLNLIDRYLSLSKEQKENLLLGRRMGIYHSVEDLPKPELSNQVEKVLHQIEGERPGDVEKVLCELMESFI